MNLTLQTGFNAIAGGIRGTGTISILTTQDPSVGILIDEFALNHVQTQFVELYDLEQVEVYRGPQGTLFGKNSTGGTIVITSKRPSLDEFGDTFRVSTGGYDGGSDNFKAQAGIDIPIIEGKLGFRFAGSVTDEQGFYTNDKDTASFPNSPLYGVLGITPDLLPPELSLVTTGAGERLSGKDVVAAKAKLLFQPSDQYEAYFIWEIVRDDSDSPASVNETPAVSARPAPRSRPAFRTTPKRTSTSRWVSRPTCWTAGCASMPRRSTPNSRTYSATRCSFLRTPSAAWKGRRPLP